MNTVLTVWCSIHDRRPSCFTHLIVLIDVKIEMKNCIFILVCVSPPVGTCFIFLFFFEGGGGGGMLFI